LPAHTQFGTTPECLQNFACLFSLFIPAMPRLHPGLAQTK
jgi:hypothetical protein